MKDVKVLPVQQAFLEPIPGLTPGLPPLNGWTVQYISGIEGASLTHLRYRGSIANRTGTLPEQLAA